jgi:hypothetical protein
MLSNYLIPINNVNGYLFRSNGSRGDTSILYENNGSLFMGGTSSSTGNNDKLSIQKNVAGNFYGIDVFNASTDASARPYITMTNGALKRGYMALESHTSATPDRMDYATTAGDMAWYTVGTLGMTLSTSHNLSITGTASASNFYYTSSTPTISAGAGAGTSPTISIAGTNQSFTVQLTVGTLPTAAATIWTVTFSNSFAFPTAARATFSPANSAAAGLSATSMVFVSPGNTTATILMTAGTVALPAGTYIWNVNVLGN